MSPLGNASADECADYCIVMFSDLNLQSDYAEFISRWRLLQCIGMSLRAMATYEKWFGRIYIENETSFTDKKEM